jgi:hypothetical protein
MTDEEAQKMSGVTIRRLSQTDTPAVVRLAALDSNEVPEGELLGIEIEGRLVAVTPIAGGETVADPFSRTGELRALLELRAAQIRNRQPRRSRLGGLLSRRGAPTAPTPPGHPGLLRS